MKACGCEDQHVGLALILCSSPVCFRDIGKLPGDVRSLHGEIEQNPAAVTVVSSEGRGWAGEDAAEHRAQGELGKGS